MSEIVDCLEISTLSEGLLSNKHKNNISTKESLIEISKITFPTILFYFCLFLQQNINIMFIGNKYTGDAAENALNALGISNLYINVFILSIIVGMLTGFEAMGSNAYGAREYRLFGMYYQRSQIICNLINISLIAFHFTFSIDIISYFYHDDKVLAQIAVFIRPAMMFMLFNCQNSLNFRYLNIIKKAQVNVIFILVNTMLHPLWCYIALNYFDLGIPGVAYAMVLTQLLGTIMGCIYIYIIKPLPESIFFYNKHTFSNWGSYFKIAIPSALLMIAKWWPMEIIAVMTIWIGKVDYTVHVILSGITLVINSHTVGFTMTSVILIGREMGSGDVRQAKHFFKITYLLGLIIISGIACLILIFRINVLRLYSNDTEAIIKASNIIYLLSGYLIAEYTQSSFSGALRGLGKQKTTSFIAFLNFYFIQIGAAYLFGIYFAMGVKGIWIGILIGGLSGSIMYLIFILNIDWIKIKKETFLRIASDKKENEKN